MFMIEKYIYSCINYKKTTEIAIVFENNYLMPRFVICTTIFFKSIRSGVNLFPLDSAIVSAFIHPLKKLPV